MLLQNEEIYQNFEEKRKIGENESYIAELIRNDSIEEFIIYINKTNLNISTFKIKHSIFETNAFLIENGEQTLIEYAAFYGSIQIFQYLKMNNVNLTPSLWLYSIHGNNPELIHLLEENQIDPEDKSYENCFKESIKCHHIEISNYLQYKIINPKQSYDNNITNYSFEYYNFEYFPSFINDKFILHYACRYNYFLLVKLLVQSKKVDINLIAVFFY